MELNDRVALFRNMVSSCYNLYLWTYDCAMHLQESNCPEQDASHTLLMVSLDRPEYLADLAGADTPVLVNNQVDMMWLIQPYMEEKELLRFYVLGPFFISDVSAQNVEAMLIGHGLPYALREKMHSYLHGLPIIAWSRIQEYAIMLYRCVMDGCIMTSDLRFYKRTEEPVSPLTSNSTKELPEQPIAHGTYRAEQEMLRMVREGDMRLIEFIEQAALVGNIGTLSNGDPIRQLKNATFSRFCFGPQRGNDDRVLSAAQPNRGSFPDGSRSLRLCCTVHQHLVDHQFSLWRLFCAEQRASSHGCGGAGAHHQSQSPGADLHPGALLPASNFWLDWSCLGAAVGRSAFYRSGSGAVPGDIPENDRIGRPAGQRTVTRKYTQNRTEISGTESLILSPAMTVTSCLALARHRPYSATDHDRPLAARHIKVSKFCDFMGTQFACERQQKPFLIVYNAF